MMAAEEKATEWQSISAELDLLLLRSSGAIEGVSVAESSARTLKEALEALKMRVEAALESHTAQHYPLLVTLHRIVSNSHSIHFSVLEPKLRALQHAASTASASLQRHSDALSSLLHRRDGISRSRQLLHEMLRSEACLCALEAATRSFVATPPPFVDLLRILDRLESYLLSRSAAARWVAVATTTTTEQQRIDSHLALFMAQRPRLKQAESRVLQWLDAEFERARAQDARQSLSTLFECYARIEQAPHIERLIMSPGRKFLDHESQQRGAEALAAFESWVRTDVAPLIDLTSPLDFKFPLRAIWRHVSESALLASTQSASTTFFMNSDASSVHRNYRALKSLQNYIDSLCRSSTERDDLSRDPSWRSVERRWNWAVYFQLRAIDVLSDLHRLLCNSNIGSSSENSSVFALEQSESAFEALLRLFNPNPNTHGVFVLPLAHRLLKVALQVIARYTAWASQVWAQRLSHDLIASYQPALSLLGDCLLMSERLRESNPTGGGLKVLRALVEDLDMCRLHPDVVSSLTESLQVSALQLRKTMIATTEEAMVEYLYNLCISPNKAAGSTASLLSSGVRALSSQYLLTNERGMPTSASPYARSLLRPLEELSSKTGLERRIDRDIWDAWFTRTIQRVLVHYCDTIGQFAQATSKRQEFLNRQRRATTATTGSNESAGMKMIHQLRLDVEEVNLQIGRLIGVASQSLSAYQDLQTLITETVPQLLCDV